MGEGREQVILRAGVLMGLGGGLCLGCGAMLVAYAVGLLQRIEAAQPVVLTLGILPLICVVSGAHMLRKARAAD